jgi:hypothetical protein
MEDDGIDVLERIIKEEGSCNWAKPKDCSRCPISKSRLRTDRVFYSCIEAVGAQNSTEEEADKLYLKAAQNLLADLELEKVLKDDI